jgi:hypothetical protein
MREFILPKDTKRLKKNIKHSTELPFILEQALKSDEMAYLVGPEILVKLLN